MSTKKRPAQRRDERQAEAAATESSQTTNLQLAPSRKPLSEVTKAQIIEALGKPGANMTRISADTGVSYGTVLGIKQRLVGQRPGARPAAKSDDAELMRLELDFLRRKVALLEGRTKGKE